MKAIALVRRRMAVAPGAFVEIVIRLLPELLAPSAHRSKYRFVSAERLVADFGADMERWDRENRRP